MITLLPVTKDNYNECLDLKREKTDYVGDAYAVLADSYISRHFACIRNIPQR